mgnify:CR=1 FL=1
MHSGIVDVVVVDVVVVVVVVDVVVVDVVVVDVVVVLVVEDDVVVVVGSIVVVDVVIFKSSRHSSVESVNLSCISLMEVEAFVFTKPFLPHGNFLSTV